MASFTSDIPASLCAGGSSRVSYTHVQLYVLRYSTHFVHSPVPIADRTYHKLFHISDNKKIYDRVINESNYIINTNKTIREVADIFNVSKSTVHNDIRKRLIFIDKDLYEEIKNKLSKRKNQGSMFIFNKLI